MKEKSALRGYPVHNLTWFRVKNSFGTSKEEENRVSQERNEMIILINKIGGVYFSWHQIHKFQN